MRGTRESAWSAFLCGQDTHTGGGSGICTFDMLHASTPSAAMAMRPVDLRYDVPNSDGVETPGTGELGASLAWSHAAMLQSAMPACYHATAAGASSWSCPAPRRNSMEPE